MTNETISTSVVIPALRAWSTLPAVLDALTPQLQAGREAIVVDSGGAEPPADCLQRWPWLRLITVPERLLPGTARNLGSARARGELIAFLDADTVPSPDWLHLLEEAMTPRLDAVAGTIRNGTPGSPVGTAEYLLACSETFPHRPRPLRHAPGANLLVRRGYFETVGGFREDLRAGEDTILTFPLAGTGRLALAPAATVRHLNRTSLRPFIANQRRQGSGFIHVCALVPYPNRWVSRGRCLWLAGPLRLLALARCLLWNRTEVRPALRALPALLIGTAAWALGAFEARRAPLPPRDTGTVAFSS